MAVRSTSKAALGKSLVLFAQTFTEARSKTHSKSNIDWSSCSLAVTLPLTASAHVLAWGSLGTRAIAMATVCA